VVATLRTSGTEPKLKWYCEGRGAAGVGVDVVRGEVGRTVAGIVDDMIRPEAWGLTRPKVEW
jgi:phosphomannomutase